MRRTKTTTYGQRGGEGPNTGRKAVTFAFTRPDGVEGKTRVFKNPPEGPEAFVILYPPHNGYDWHVGRVAESQGSFDEVLRNSNQPGNAFAAPPPVVVTCRRVG
ncbi:hypothetical protein [Microcystis phage Mwe-JY26]